ncbi:FecR domain-containing protein [Rhodocytophaga aerolata]|uniref:FecR domain-containing protein n=1 Tax=Rhodocytophaga aerolata TaxID=455078 RepID=A0ABT8RDZ9_9BACT|nr:FecR domain-containing protein [Rhodocytophaga aerolata]MDO1449921.1 FecR domain-containing protein [Rhodocytophaga aerolata]
MRKDYTQYRVKDLLEDEDFLHWMKYNEEASAQFWQSWLVQYPQKAEILQQARQLYNFLHLQQEPESTRQDELDVLQGIQEKIAAPQAPKSAKIRSLYGTLARWAAILVLMAGVSFYVYKTLNKHQEKASWFTYQSEGTVRRLTLPDGTLITLNKNSFCRYSPLLSESDTREVWIEGEAFLEVSHQTTKEGRRKAFVVHMQSMDVEVLGTRFNVINAPARQNVVLEKGSVRVNQKGQAILLKPGEIIHIADSRLIKNQVNPKLYTGWLNGTLQLENTSLEEILQLLEYKYGYSIDYPQQPSILQQKMSGSLDVRSQQVLFHTLSLAYNIQITHQDQHIIITLEKPASNP